MPRVNLIYERRRRERQQELLARGIAVGCEIFAVLLAAVILLPVGLEYQKRREISQVEIELQSKSQMRDQVERIKKQVADLEPKLALLQTAQGSTMHWYLIFQQVGQGLPVYSWVENINYSLMASKDPAAKGPGQETLKVSGHTLAAENVADTMRQLEQQPLFGEVSLASVTLTTASGPNTRETANFEMEIKLKKAQAPTDATTTRQNQS